MHFPKSFYVGALVLGGCTATPFGSAPPPYSYQSFEKFGTSEKDVISQMKACGFSNVYTTLRSETLNDIAAQERCMLYHGFNYKDKSNGVCGAQGRIRLEACDGK